MNNTAAYIQRFYYTTIQYAYYYHYFITLVRFWMAFLAQGAVVYCPSVEIVIIVPKQELWSWSRNYRQTCFVQYFARFKISILSHLLAKCPNSLNVLQNIQNIPMCHYNVTQFKYRFFNIPVIINYSWITNWKHFACCSFCRFCLWWSFIMKRELK